MTLKQQIISTLKSIDFPDLKFLYSSESLALSPEILDELLEQEKADFAAKLETPDDEISFDTFQDFSLLDYYFSLLEHYQGVHSDDNIRKIIEDFEPKYIDFGNEVSYSKRYYDMLKICINETDLDEQQTRIITKSIEGFEVRGIALDEEKQSELKAISKELSEKSQKFSNNVVDSKKEFEYVITDESIISQMPDDDTQAAKDRYEKKYKIKQASSDDEIKECFTFFEKMWKTEFELTLRKDHFERFRKSDIFYIAGDELIACVQVVSIDEVNLEHDNELVGVANIGEKLLGRIGVLKTSRGKGIGSKLIEFVQNYYGTEGEKRMFIPSATQNENYYNSFGFVRISEPVDCGNTQKIMMQCDLGESGAMQKENYLFDSSQGAYMSIMKYCSDSSVRKYFYEFRHRVATKGELDNTPLILDMLRLRNRKAEILGFKNYGELSLKFKMAESPEQIMELFGDISSKAKPKSKAELDEIREYFNLDDLQVWDLGYYANILRKEKYELDDRELKKYFEFEAVLEGMFEIINRLYGIEMKKLDIESYSEEVQVYEVSRNGKFLSYFFTDYFYNELKRPGAWANIVRERFGENKKITLNVCNFQKSESGKTLLTLGDVETMFHEFGHATHEMLSRSEHSELSGFHVEWDFVELPSQLLENWCRDKQGMSLFAKHVETGAGVPDEMFHKLEQLSNFGSGEFIITQNTYAMMDMGLHSNGAPKNKEELEAFINKNYDDNGSFPRGDIYSPHTSFTHIFDGGYAAGYYSYMWAEIIEKEVWKAFKDSGDIFSPEVSQKFLDTILSAGTTKKASELFRDFFGRDVKIDAFLEEKGLI